MTLHTSICDMLGIEYPIFAAGMGGVTMAPLTAAISAAGGCGVLGATFCTPDELRAEIRAVREEVEGFADLTAVKAHNTFPLLHTKHALEATRRQ